jgi:HlyD family secretion protein
MKRRTTYILIGVVAVAAGAVYYLARNGETKTSYRFDKVDRGDIVVEISATGTLNATRTVDVGTQVSGTISKLCADFNSQVTKGQLMATLDTTFLQASLEAQEANVDKAKAQLDDAQRTFNRTTDLFNKGMVSQADLDVTVTAVATAKASLRQAGSARNQAKVNLQYATILAPINGVVISRNVDVGQTVAASLSAPTLFVIANDLSKMQVTASVDEADIGQVKQGQAVSFRVDAYPDEKFSGIVSQIRLSPVTSQNVVTYNVIIDVDNPKLELMPGMTATCSIIVAKSTNTLRLPLQAIRFTPPNARAIMASLAGPMSGGAQASTNHPVSDTTVGRPPDPPPGGPGGMGERDTSFHRMRGDRRFDSTRMRPNGAPDSTGMGRHRWNREGDSTARPWSRRGDSTFRAADSASRVRVWVMNNGQIRPVMLIKGIQNQKYVELAMTNLVEGDSVIIGTNSTSESSATSTSTSNPFMPRMPGGGGPPGGGGGGRR